MNLYCCVQFQHGAIVLYESELRSMAETRIAQQKLRESKLLQPLPELVGLNPSEIFGRVSRIFSRTSLGSYSILDLQSADRRWVQVGREVEQLDEARLEVNKMLEHLRRLKFHGGNSDFADLRS